MGAGVANNKSAVTTTVACTGIVSHKTSCTALPPPSFRLFKPTLHTLPHIESIRSLSNPNSISSRHPPSCLSSRSSLSLDSPLLPSFFRKTGSFQFRFFHFRFITFLAPYSSAIWVLVLILLKSINYYVGFTTTTRLRAQHLTPPKKEKKIRASARIANHDFHSTVHTTSVSVFSV